MGNANTSNVAKATVEAISKQTADTIQSTNNSSASSQVITIKGLESGGDIIIDGLKQNMVATINTKNLMKAVTKQGAQQSLTQNLSQSAKSLMSGINLGQFTDANNEMDAFMSASIDIASHIEQDCATSINQDQRVIFQGLKSGNDIKILNVDQESIANIFTSCLLSSLTQQSSVTTLQQTLDQKASATSKGVSMWALVVLAIIALLFVSLPIILPLIGAASLLTKFMFPIIMIVGIAFIVIYMTKAETANMTDFGFSKLIENSGACSGKVLSTSTAFATPGDASVACAKNKDAVAYDWKGYIFVSPDNVPDSVKSTTTPDPNSTANPNVRFLNNPITTFYSSVGQNPCDVISKNLDSYNIWRMPIVVVTKDNPTGIKKDGTPFGDGDIWINPSTTEWQKFKSDIGDWSSGGQSSGKLVDDFDGEKNKFTWSADSKIPGKDTGSPKDVYATWTKQGNPYFTVWVKGSVDSGNTQSAWNKSEAKPYPGAASGMPKRIDPVTNKPLNQPSFNSSGFKTMVKEWKWMLYIGIALSILGTGGTVYTFTKGRKKSSGGKAASKVVKKKPKVSV